ncbi:NADH-quinone oxidoreductase subunit M [Desulfovibrionales bacterium]
MSESAFPVLTWLIFFPLAAAILLLLLRNGKLIYRVFTLCTGVVELGLSLSLLARFRLDTGELQLVEKTPWVPQWGLTYHLAVDGLSLLIIVLTALLLPLCVLCSWTYIERRVKEFHVCLLLMTSACVGVFTAMDLVLFYIFWEAMLIPMYLIIAVWGGPERRYASLKFFLYTLAGSTLLLVAIIAFYYVGGSLSIPELMRKTFSFRFQCWTFLAMSLAFAVKVPMFPFHTWLPAAHVEAPAAGSVLLASILLKMGAYGFLRFCLPLTPAACEYFAPLMITVSIVSILYGGCIALGQQDIKKLIAYSSVAHMGFVTLGIFLSNQRGIEGALMVMVNHGIVTGGLFMMIGLIYERSHSRLIANNLGLGKYLPAYMGFFGLFTLSSLGFPGLNCFVGELLVLIGTFTKKVSLGAWIIPGVMLAAAYMLRLGLKLAWGKPYLDTSKNWKDLNSREWICLTPLAVLILYIGLAPGPTLATMTPSVQKLLRDFYQHTTDYPIPFDAPPEQSAAISLNQPAMIDMMPLSLIQKN